MSTPNEESWPGVSELKDYKPTFPKWSDNVLKDTVKNINSDAVDLMQVLKVLIYLNLYVIYKILI